MTPQRLSGPLTRVGTMSRGHLVLVLAVLALTVALAGCVGSDPPASEPTAPQAAANGSQSTAIRAVPTADGRNATPPTPLDRALPALGFTEPVTLPVPSNALGNADAFEPSIEVAPDGTVYATAATGVSVPGTATARASWLWYSDDSGESWSSLPSPQQGHESQPGFEGDIAVDTQGRLYFADTYLADNTLSRWSPGEEGPTWDFSRPLHGTAGVDDRPWLAAHGDGIVYYLGNNGAMTPTPGNALNGEQPSRIWLSVSEDAGRTFELRRGFPSSEFCVPAASPDDDTTVLVTCTHVAEGVHVVENPALVEGYSAKVHLSEDRGQTWQSTLLRPIDGEPAWWFPSAAIDEDGTPYAVWGEGNGPTRLYVARQTGQSWEVMDVTPFDGTMNRTWVTAGSDGTVAVVFYGTHDTDPGPESAWHPYALVTDGAEADTPVWTLSRVTDSPVAQGARPPYDFFQADVGPDDELHVVYGNTADVLEVFYTRSTDPLAAG